MNNLGVHRGLLRMRESGCLNPQRGQSIKIDIWKPFDKSITTDINHVNVIDCIDQSIKIDTHNSSGNYCYRYYRFYRFYRWMSLISDINFVFKRRLITVKWLLSLCSQIKLCLYFSKCGLLSHKWEEILVNCVIYKLHWVTRAFLTRAQARTLLILFS